MDEKYYINDDVSTSTLIINKSKFISFAHKVTSEEEINNLLKMYQKKYYDSTHVCYAYVLSSGQEKAFDDGEPSKTAGMPILDVIKKKNLTDIIIFVVRYFGGILLGAGGLVRAYNNSAVKVLENVKLYKKVKAYDFNLVLNYKEFDTLKKINNIKINDVIYANDVNVSCTISHKFYDELENILLSNNILSSISNVKESSYFEEI